MASSTAFYAVQPDKTIFLNAEGGTITISVHDGLLRVAATWHPHAPPRLADDLAQLLDDWNRRGNGLIAAGDRTTLGSLIIVGAHSGRPVGAGIDDGDLRVEVPWNSRVEKREVRPRSPRTTLRAVTGWNVDSRLLTMIVEPDGDAPGGSRAGKRPVRVVAYGIWCLAAGASDRQLTELVVEAAGEAEKFIRYCRSSFMKEEEDDGAGA